uniref:HIT domain-containing protein n=1 Tax=Arcella intermedia TaxID=1963864 RepID=A0A6B2LEA4_9EUKA
MKSASASQTADVTPKKTKPPSSGGGLLSLKSYITNPEAHQDQIIYSDDRFVVIKDLYPKATVHLLVIPKEDLPNFSYLDMNHLPLLRKMRKLAILLIRQYSASFPNLEFKAGFHAIPSMKPIHMHFISLDFSSEHLKTKKHWNSFTTEFFIPIENFILELEKSGKIEFPKEKYDPLLKGPIMSLDKAKVLPNMPSLKEYLNSLKKETN